MAETKNGTPPKEGIKEVRVMAKRGTEIARRTESGLTRWDPWKEFQEMRRFMDDMWDRFFGRSFSRLFSEVGDYVWRPPVDLYETDDELVLRCYLPGLRKEDINLDVTETNVSVHGTYPEPEQKDVQWHTRCFEGGTFSLSYDLPVEIQPDKVKATYTNGVLEVHLPKSEAAKPHRVKVTVEG
jgi:HSP20 family protein